ncbi:hypothetical protein [Bacillus marasmi]|uniref:hypothetical protein n=1 Tax=Bacillus marasmi TaxID=1926279 RepID=UPI0011C745D0|nr:hypothetical protein [Bacillus marasmi]
MKKKTLGVIGLSGAILLGSVYSISANTSGYELYKSALKQTHQADSATMEMSFNLLDNEASLFSMNSQYKTDVSKEVSAMTTETANENEKSTMNMYKQDGAWFVTKAGEDVIYKMEAKNPHSEASLELQDDMENLVDVLTKNLQQQITVDETKAGVKIVELDLTGKEIPLAANALSSLMIKHSVMLQDRMETDGSQFHLTPTIPALDHDITVKQINLTAEVNAQNIIEKQTVKAIVTGKDKQGKTHELALNMKLDVKDYNKTTVSPVEIPADKVEMLEVKHGGHGM